MCSFLSLLMFRSLTFVYAIIALCKYLCLGDSVTLDLSNLQSSCYRYSLSSCLGLSSLRALVQKDDIAVLNLILIASLITSSRAHRLQFNPIR